MDVPRRGPAPSIMKRLLGSQLVRQGGAYGAIGLLQIGVDWLIYVLLTSVGVAVVPANLVGRVCGAALGFTLNGVFTFRGAEGARLGWPRLLKFLVSWGLMTLLSTLAMAWTNAEFGLGTSWVLKPMVDFALAVAGFLVSRYWIYR